MSAPKPEIPIAEPISVKIPEAVRLTGLSRSRIYELMRSGDIQFAKVGSSTLILVDSLRHFVQRRVESAGKEACPLIPRASDLDDPSVAVRLDRDRSRAQILQHRPDDLVLDVVDQSILCDADPDVLRAVKLAGAAQHPLRIDREDQQDGADN